MHRIEGIRKTGNDRSSTWLSHKNVENKYVNVEVHETTVSENSSNNDVGLMTFIRTTIDCRQGDNSYADYYFGQTKRKDGTEKRWKRLLLYVFFALNETSIENGLSSAYQKLLGFLGNLNVHLLRLWLVESSSSEINRWRRCQLPETNDRKLYW